MKIGITLLATILGVALFMNGVAMLYDPEAWFWNVPGIARSGLYNQQFVRDLGVVYLFIGAGFVAGVVTPARSAQRWAVSSLWLLAHALFHIIASLSGACAPFDFATDFPVVVMPALLGLALTCWAIAEQLWPTPRQFEVAPDTLGPFD